jgi:magnesium chelatase accessory protein
VLSRDCYELDWERDRASWPLHEASQFVRSEGLLWHVQRLGQGPLIVLIHGTGASTHSWRGLLPLLAQRWSVLAFDLPGHGFTRGTAPAGLSDAGMGAAVSALLQSLRAEPRLLVGHSAGAVVALRLVLEGRYRPRGVISLNGALRPFAGIRHALFAPLAKGIARLPLSAQLLSRRARNRRAVESLMATTGSRLRAADIDLYWRLLRSPRHVNGVLQMMAQWDLDGFARLLPRLAVPFAQLVGSADRTVPPAQAERVQAMLPRAQIVTLPGLGHLAHEEDPDAVERAIVACASAWDV